MPRSPRNPRRLILEALRTMGRDVRRLTGIWDQEQMTFDIDLPGKNGHPGSWRKLTSREKRENQPEAMRELIVYMRSLSTASLRVAEYAERRLVELEVGEPTSAD